LSKLRSFAIGLRFEFSAFDFVRRSKAGEDVADARADIAVVLLAELWLGLLLQPAAITMRRSSYCRP
jgi:hypothetical protein